MIPDYTFASLTTMPRHELEEFSARMLSRMVPEEVMSEIFTFEHEEVDNEDRLLAARFDAMLRMTAIALSEIQQAFNDSDHVQQNSERMTRLILWHFYAIAFHLEAVVPLNLHCQQVETLLIHPPVDEPGWIAALTELLHYYADISDRSNRPEGIGKSMG